MTEQAGPGGEHASGGQTSGGHAGDGPAGGGQTSISVDGATWAVPAGITIAAAFTRQGRPGWRRTRLRGEPRGVSCGIGVCFDCLVTVNGTPGVRACLAEVRPGDVIVTEDGSGFTSEPPGLAGWTPQPRRPETTPAEPGRPETTPAEPGRPGATPAAPGPDQCDVAVIGAGPAGLTAAVAAADAGCTVQVLDLGQRPGGQYWRWGPATADGRFHHGWSAFTALRERFAAHQAGGRIVYRPEHAVFQVQPPAAVATGYDSSRAGSVPARGGSDHARAGSNSARAGSDHARPGSNSARTGSDHARPGSNSARTGSDHVRPGSNSARTGSDGARASFDGAGSVPERRFLVHAVAGDRERGYAAVAARAVIVATGAYDVQLPVPGWTLPGVMAAGAAQSLLKGSAVTAGSRVVVAGTGPFLLPVAAGLAQAGARVVAVAEAGQPLDYLRHPAGLAASWRKLPEAGPAARLARHRVPVLRRHAVIAAHGQGRLESVTLARLDAAWRPVPGTERTLEADVLAAGYGFVPQVELLAEAGAELAAGGPAAPGAPVAVAVAGPDQQTSVPGLFAAGETTGVGGSDLARAEGEIAGRAAARYLGRRAAPPPRSVVRERAALRRFAAVMQSVHAVQPGWAGWPGDDTVICRCEEVTLARLRAAAGLGADDARSIKLLARPGMGWCQGRICGPPVAALLATGPGLAAAEEPGGPAGAGAAGDPRPTDQEAAEPGLASQAAASVPARPLAQPVPLGVLARLASPGEPGAEETDRPEAGGDAGDARDARDAAGSGSAGPDDLGNM